MTSESRSITVPATIRPPLEEPIIVTSSVSALTLLALVLTVVPPSPAFAQGGGGSQQLEGPDLVEQLHTDCRDFGERLKERNYFIAKVTAARLLRKWKQQKPVEVGDKPKIEQACRSLEAFLDLAESLETEQNRQHIHVKLNQIVPAGLAASAVALADLIDKYDGAQGEINHLGDGIVKRLDELRVEWNEAKTELEERARRVSPLLKTAADLDSMDKAGSDGRREQAEKQLSDMEAVLKEQEILNDEATNPKLRREFLAREITNLKKRLASQRILLQVRDLVLKATQRSGSIDQIANSKAAADEREAFIEWRNRLEVFGREELLPHHRSELKATISLVETALNKVRARFVVLWSQDLRGKLSGAQSKFEGLIQTAARDRTRAASVTSVITEIGRLKKDVADTEEASWEFARSERVPSDNDHLKSFSAELEPIRTRFESGLTLLKVRARLGTLEPVLALADKPFDDQGRLSLATRAELAGSRTTIEVAVKDAQGVVPGPSEPLAALLKATLGHADSAVQALDRLAAMLTFRERVDAANDRLGQAEAALAAAKLKDARLTLLETSEELGAIDSTALREAPMKEYPRFATLTREPKGRLLKLERSAIGLRDRIRRENNWFNLPVDRGGESNTDGEVALMKPTYENRRLAVELLVGAGKLDEASRQLDDLPAPPAPAEAARVAALREQITLSRAAEAEEHSDMAAARRWYDQLKPPGDLAIEVSPTALAAASALQRLDDLDRRNRNAHLAASFRKLTWYGAVIILTLGALLLAFGSRPARLIRSGHYLRRAEAAARLGGGTRGAAFLRRAATVLDAFPDDHPEAARLRARIQKAVAKALPAAAVQADQAQVSRRDHDHGITAPRTIPRAEFLRLLTSCEPTSTASESLLTLLERDHRSTWHWPLAVFGDRPVLAISRERKAIIDWLRKNLEPRSALLDEELRWRADHAARCAELLPDDSWPRLYQLRALTTLGDYRKAILALHGFDPKRFDRSSRGEARRLLALCYLGLGRHAEAMPILERLQEDLRLAPRSSPWLMIASAHLQTKSDADHGREPDNAVELIQALLGPADAVAEH